MAPSVLSVVSTTESAKISRKWKRLRATRHSFVQINDGMRNEYGRSVGGLRWGVVNYIQIPSGNWGTIPSLSFCGGGRDGQNQYPSRNPSLDCG